jgi:LPXTG-motif cell wall-anchored protein
VTTNPLETTVVATSVPPAGSNLPRTGGAGEHVSLAFALVVVGAALVGLGRRRTRPQYPT